ncbi:MAG: hypothetical protein FWB85_03535 [Chitinispirillia bacterium]|nr:hypothetical protein [Chitinispirillia bacterium]
MIFDRERRIFNIERWLGRITRRTGYTGQARKRYKILYSEIVVPDNEKIAETLHRVESEIKEVRSHEIGVVIDRSGREIYRVDGWENSVGISSGCVKNRIVTHNHPADDCMLSYKDVESTVKGDAYEVRVVVSNGRFVSLKKNAETWDDNILIGLNNAYCCGSGLKFFERAERAARIKHGGKITNLQIKKEAENIINEWFRVNAAKYNCLFKEDFI